MRKVLPIFLLTCILLNVTGTWLFFAVQKASLKHEMLSQLKKISCRSSQEIETVVLDLNHPNAASMIEWEGSDEFRYGNEMYDVIDNHTNGTQVIIHCISDKTETNLLKNFRSANEKQSGQNSILLSRLLTTNFIPSFYTPLTVPFKGKSIYVTYLPPALQKQVRRILLPPPQSA